MNVVVYGATGNSGSEIVKELIARGHKVTGVARKVDSLKDKPGVTAKTDDLSNVDEIAAIIKGADAVVSAYQPPADNTDALVDVTKRQIEAVKKAGGTRLVVVGGAGLLEVAPGVTLIKSGYLPVEYLPIATSHEKALGVLQGFGYRLDVSEPRGLLCARGADREVPAGYEGAGVGCEGREQDLVCGLCDCGGG